MKQMTTAEFQKTTLASIEEPVEIRRYREVQGFYYPAGFAPHELPPAPETVPTVPTVPVADTRKLDELEAEIARLKRELEARTGDDTQTDAVLAAFGHHRSYDPFTERIVPPAPMRDPLLDKER